MIKKINDGDAEIYVKEEKDIRIPHEFEQVSRRKQTEESGRDFDVMANEEFADLAANAVIDDEEGQDDAYKVRDPIPSEEILNENDGEDDDLD